MSGSEAVPVHLPCGTDNQHQPPPIGLSTSTRTLFERYIPNGGPMIQTSGARSAWSRQRPGAREMHHQARVPARHRPPGLAAASRSAPRFGAHRRIRRQASNRHQTGFGTRRGAEHGLWAAPASSSLLTLGSVGRYTGNVRRLHGLMHTTAACRKEGLRGSETPTVCCRWEMRCL